MSFFFGKKPARPSFSNLPEATTHTMEPESAITFTPRADSSCCTVDSARRMTEIEQQLVVLTKQISTQTKMIERLIESNRLLISWHRTTSESDARKLNLSVRSFYTGSPATKFVATASDTTF